jgi:hypothetical protein
MRARLLALAMLASPLAAGAAQEFGASWVQLGALSYHADRTQQYNENNPGLGFEYRLDGSSLLAVGRYKNSFFGTSKYVLWGWTPLDIGAITFVGMRIPSVRIGVMLGAVDGYRRSSGHFAPALLPLLSFEGRELGVNISALPNIGDIKGGVAIQFKAKFERDPGNRLSLVGTRAPEP